MKTAIEKWEAKTYIRDNVFTAARHADKEYDGGHEGSQGISRAEYVGRAVLKLLYSDVV